MIKTLNFIVANWLLALANTEVMPRQRALKKYGKGKKTSQPQIDFAVGGQAVIEGVMMRSPHSITIAVRKANKKIKIKKQRYHTLVQRYKNFNVPLVRGVINLFEMMVIGTKAINFSANEMLEDSLTPAERKKLRSQREKPHVRALEYLYFVFSLIVALAFSIFLFKFAPLWIATFIGDHFAYIDDHYLLFNAFDGLFKILIFVSYMALLTLFDSFKRIFEYHGAEHKSIFAYENKLSLTVRNAKRQTRFHPRCGTSFILIVFTISILVYTLVPRQETFLENFILRVALLPLIAGIAYEYLKISARYAHRAWVKIFVTPGLWFQRLTTREPDNAQLEVGLTSLQAALEMENTCERQRAR